MNQYFLPPREPYATGKLAVDEIHTLYYEQCGNPNGIPILFIHGGPGAGCSAADRCFFDESKFRTILFDQRGCGRSAPAGELRENTIDHLVRDIEQLRVGLGIARWHIFGGSWGSTLSIYYAQKHPDSILSMTLRGIWLLRRSDLDWWLYQIASIQPELWRGFAEFIPEAERGDLLEAYWQRLTGDDRETALQAARHWSVYEISCCTLLPNEEFSEAFAKDEPAWNLARLEAQYFRAGIQPDNLLLEQVDRLRDIPAFAVHGRYDIVCPVKALDDLRHLWPELDWEIVPDAGHSSHETGITKELVAATNRIAATGSPVRT